MLELMHAEAELAHVFNAFGCTTNMPHKIYEMVPRLQGVSFAG
jgi:hypothetical protein